MATRTPIVQASGELQQLQSNDPLSPQSVVVLRLVTASCTFPANTSLISVDSMTFNNGADLIIPNTSTLLIQNTSHPYLPYWTAILQTASDFSTASTAGVDILALSYTALANATYEVEVTLYGTGGADTNGIRVGVAYSGTHNNGEAWYAIGSTTTSSVATIAAAIGTVNGGFWTTTGAFCSVKVYSVIHTTGVGNITAQTAKVAGVALTISQGSTMKIRRLS